MKKLPILFAALLAAWSLGACTVIGDVESVGGGGNAGGDAGVDGGGGDAAPGDGGLTSAQLRLAFGKCMTLAEWDANNIGQIALTQTTPPCSDAGCHGGGQKPILTATSTATFNQTIIDDISLASYVVANAGQLTQSQAFLTIGQPGSGHPVTFTLAANINLTNFFNLTKARFDANGGNCP